jgi:hypothetical protein
MTLKSATLLVAISLMIGLALSLSQWTLFTFSLLDFSQFEWLFRGIGLIGILLNSVPMIVFFLVLNARQKGR